MFSGTGESPVTVNSLGSCSIRVDGAVQSGIPLNFFKIATYIFLAAPGYIVSRDAIRNLLWPDVNDREKIAADLRQSLMRIRRMQEKLGFCLIESNAASVYLVEDESIHWDLRDLVQRMDRPDYDERIQYAGELLADLPFSGTEFEDWLSEQRQNLRSRVVEFLCLAIEMEDHLRHQRRYEHARDLLRIDPCNEEAYRLLMIKAASNRDFSQLDYLYKRCEHNLENDLGIRVSHETRSLHSGLRKAMYVELQPAAPGDSV